MGDRIKAFFKNSVGYIMAFFFTAGYISLSILTIDRTGRTVGEIVGTSFIYYIYQIVLITLFRSQGLNNGKNSETYKNTSLLHAEKVESISDNMDMLPQWCDEKNKENYKKQRIKILASAALKYLDYFDEDGIVIKSYEVDSAKTSLKWKNRFIRRAGQCDHLCHRGIPHVSAAKRLCGADAPGLGQRCDADAGCCDEGQRRGQG